MEEIVLEKSWLVKRIQCISQKMDSEQIGRIVRPSGRARYSAKVLRVDLLAYLKRLNL